MKSLFTYLNEVKGYLDYTDFIKDIKIQITEHIKDYIFDKYNEALEKYKNSSIPPKMPTIFPNISFVVNSKNYPSWLNSLTIQDFSHIEGYDSISFADTIACVEYLNIINSRNIKTFFKSIFDEKADIKKFDVVFDGTRFHDYIYTIACISKIYQMDIENDKTTNEYELNSIVKNSGVSNILFNRDYKGKTYKDFRNFLIKLYNKTIQDTKKILIKAAKNV